MFEKICNRFLVLTSRLKNFLLDLFFPLECLTCRAPGTAWCGKCVDKVVLENGPAVSLGLVNGVAAAAARYKDVEKFIALLKYQFITVLKEPLGRLLLRRLAGLDLKGDYILVPVPLHRRRERERGFNQAALLAEEVSRTTGWPVLKVLIRGKHTRPQVGLAREARLKNVVKAFLLAPDAGSAVAGQKVILVDDVYTTGTTIGECARLLRQAGATEVYALVLAKG